MKKILCALSSASLLVVSNFSLISCSWKIPPLTTEQLSHIFETVQKDVFRAYENDVPLFDKKVDNKLPWNYKEDNQSSDLAKTWNDNIVAVFGKTLAATDTGYINKKLDVITGEKNDEYLNESINLNDEKLNLIKSDYFTIRISDIKSKDKNQWLSKSFDENIKVPIKINGEYQKINEKNTPNKDFFANEIFYSALDLSKLWKIGEDDFISKNFIFRFLFSFGPISKHEMPPVIFYLNMEMSK